MDASGLILAAGSNGCGGIETGNEEYNGELNED